GIGTPWASSSAVTQPDSPSTEPTDRSMPAVRMTRSWPTAMMPKMATCRARLARLSPVRNWSDPSVSAPNRTSRTTIPPASRPNTSPNVMIRSGAGAAGASAVPGGSPAVAGTRCSLLGIGTSVRLFGLCRLSIGMRAGLGPGRLRAGLGHRRLGAGAGEVEDVLLGGAGRGQFAGDAALAHDQDTVGQAEDFGQV